MVCTTSHMMRPWCVPPESRDGCRQQNASHSVHAVPKVKQLGGPSNRRRRRNSNPGSSLWQTMVSWSASGDGEGDAPGTGAGTAAHATTSHPAEWLPTLGGAAARAACGTSPPLKRGHEGAVQAAQREELLRHGQKRRRANAAEMPAVASARSVLPGNAVPRDTSSATASTSTAAAGTPAKMSVALFEEGEAPHDDVDMGTPTAASAKTATSSSWREAGRFQADNDWHRIRESTQTEPSQRRQIHPDAHTPPSTAQDVELLAFREYNDDDIDSLEILPSQDFGGDISEDDGHVAPHQADARASLTQTSPWRDFRDGTQHYEEEASEVFDNVIYAPRPSHPQAPQTATPPRRPQVDPNDMYESESELSDGFEVSLSFAPVVPEPPVTLPTPSTAHATASRPSSASSSPPDTSAHQWHARLSVKRDCSFIDCTTTKKQPRVESRVQELSESSEDFGVKLKLVERDGENHRGGSASSKPPAYSSDAPTLKSESSVPEGFCPRKKKRRKVRQPTLDAFLQVSQSSAS